MAVSKMRLVTIIGHVSKFEETAGHIIKSNCFQPENMRNLILGYKKLLPFHAENKYKNMLKKLSDFCSVSDIPLNLCNDRVDLSVEEIIAELDRLNIELSAIDERINDYKSLLNENEQISRQLLPMLNIDMNLNELFLFEFIEFRFGRMTKSSYEFMQKNIEEDNMFIFLPASIEEEYVWGIYFAPRKFIEYADGIFVSLEFERIRISENVRGTPKEAFERIENEIKEAKQQIQALNINRRSLLQSFTKNINPAYTELKLLNEIEELRNVSRHSENNFYTAGWVSLNDINKIEKEVRKVEGVSLTAESPSFSKSFIPTKLKNFTLFRPFEEFVRMYGTPQYNEIDPTFLVAITYTVMFGIMFGDVGQGLVIALTGFLLAVFKKMQFGKILISCGLSSSIFGLVYDSIFGYEGLINRNIFGNEEIEIGFSPSENVNDILFMTVGLGILLIASAMLINIINGIKQKNIEKIFFEHNGLSGFILYGAGVYALISTMLLGKTNVLTAPYIICFFVLPFLLIFFRHILSKLLTGKKDLFPSGIGEFLLENTFEMLEVLLSFLTNTISFIRIGIFALNHAGMMLVVFLLAKTTATAAFGSGNPAVLIIGNLIVIGLEGLIVGIQVLRLEFYEIFGRFFAGDGHEFKAIGNKEH